MSNPCGSNNSGAHRNGHGYTTLYIKPVTVELRYYEILSYFSAFGDVDDVQIRSKQKYSYKVVNGVRICNETKDSYGFVKYTLAESAVKALGVDCHVIAGCRVDVVVANDKHQGWTTLLDLNDDCIHEILSMKCLGIHDLCSVAQASGRLKEIAGRVFKREHRTCDINSLSDEKVKTAERILMHFGSNIRHLQIREILSQDKWTREVLPSVTRNCSKTLWFLDIQNLKISENFTAELRPLFKNLQRLSVSYCTFEGSSKELFGDCASLVALCVPKFTSGDEFILENTFPKLQKFECNSRLALAVLESFLSRHKNLKYLQTWLYMCLPALQLIANCKQLETLKCGISNNAILDLSNLGHLRKLQFFCERRSVSENVLVLNNLQCLEELSVCGTEIDLEFILSLSQLTRLRVLQLRKCTGLKNLYQIGDLSELTSLKIHSLLPVDLDVALLVKSLSKINYLRVEVPGFEMSFAKYSRLVDVVREKSDGSKITFNLYCNQPHDYDHLLQDCQRNSHLVEFNVVASR